MSWREDFSEILARSEGKVTGWFFTYFDGEDYVELPVEGILSKLRALAEELAFVSRASQFEVMGDSRRIGTGDTGITPELMIECFRQIFPAKRKFDYPASLKRIEVTKTWWMGELVGFEEPSDVGLTDRELLAVVERFFAEFEEKLKEMAEEAVTKALRMIGVREG